MSKGRLTRNELSWLLTQEAQNAAERLRVGVTFLRTQAPPPMDAAQDPAHGVEGSLDALDDVMKMLSNLNQNQRPQQGQPPPGARRGRIDLAALLVEVAPGARVSIEPGSGTEVYGEEADLRRMIQVLVGHGSGEGQTVTVRRDGDDVRVAVSLGPDSSPTAETERQWLSRMALRYGGRHELEGGNEVLVFPAEGASDRSENQALRKELDEARKQGEAYARDLAAVFDRGEEVTSISTMPPAPGTPQLERFATVTKLCAGLAAELRATLGPIGRELGSLRSASGQAPRLSEEQIETLRRRISHAQEIVASVGSIGDLNADELQTEVDVVDVAKGAIKDCGSLADQNAIKVTLRVTPEGARAYVRRGTKALGVLVCELVAHAISASPRGSAVEVGVLVEDQTTRLIVDDSGSPLPASGRRGFLALETHAGAYGRPSGLPIFMAAELAACQGAMLELSDAPANGTGGGGGLRVSVSFAKALEK